MLGPRQTGKTTLLKHQIDSDRTINFADPALRLPCEMSPNLLTAEINALQPAKQRELPLVILDDMIVSILLILFAAALVN